MAAASPVARSPAVPPLERTAMTDGRRRIGWSPPGAISSAGVQPLRASPVLWRGHWEAPHAAAFRGVQVLRPRCSFAFARRSTLAHGVRPGAVAKAGEARIVAVRATRERVAAHARVMGRLLLDGDEPPRAARGTRTCGGRMRRRYRIALDARSVRSL